nr:protein defective in meristem silencing 3-like isoform X1 [Tanacetum cinerariifolium]
MRRSESLIGDCSKSPRNKDQKMFVGGSWSDNKNEDEEKTNEEISLMDQSSNEVTLDSSYYSDNAYFLNDDAVQIEYDYLCEISLKISNKNKILKTKRGVLEKEILELNEKIKRCERNKAIDIGCESCQELLLKNDKFKESQAKFVKFDQSSNSLKEMLSVQRLPSSKGGTYKVKFVKSAKVLAGDRSFIKEDGSFNEGEDEEEEWGLELLKILHRHDLFFKIENDMMLLGNKIKQHEENIKYLRYHKNILDDAISDMQVTLGKYHSSTTPKVENDDLSHMQSEDATVENIMKHEKSVAAIFSQLKRNRNQTAHFRDVLDIVATLGKVDNDNLSRFSLGASEALTGGYKLK